ncbi:hypothetical protein ACFYWU_37650 [Streptomyces chrestomyceticus]|uniref:effector-associated constant component EACC1 n=1 Tax=Streptomyces chrestomyceticus TaxID=68185 RepID=UPI0036A06F1F
MTVAQADGTEGAASLHKWLSGDPDVAAGTGLALLARDDGPGRMGPVSDVVEAVFNGSVQLASLLVAVATWRDTRRGAARVRIERAETGIVVELDGGDPRAVRRLVRALAEDDRGDGGDPGPAGAPGPRG